MTIVLPFHAGDADMLRRSLEWHQQLGGLKNHRALLVADAGVDWETAKAMFTLSQSAYGSVEMTTNPQPKRGWIPGANSLWLAGGEYVQKQHLGPWLWMEPDAFPLGPGWADALEKEYAACGKPYMGCLIKAPPGMLNLPKEYLNGLAIYPENAHETLAAGITFTKAFDIATAPTVVPMACSSPLVAVHWGLPNKPPTFATTRTPESPINTLTLADLNPKAVVFTRCKDGSLLQILWAKHFPNVPYPNNPGFHPVAVRIHPQHQQPVKIQITDPGLTVVITSFRRPKMLMDAFASCQQAGVRRVVISASGENEDIRQVLKVLSNRSPTPVISSIPDDLGCNELWLRGARLVKTPWIHILHDDDLILPKFGQLNGMLDEGVGFYHWPGARHGDGQFGQAGKLIGLTQGSIFTDFLVPRVINGGLSLSPVTGLFHTKHVVQVLEECQELSQQFELRPGMMIGNDLLIWLRAIEKYKRFYYIPTPLVSFGHHAGSVTWNDFRLHLGGLQPLYAKMRNWWLQLPVAKGPSLQFVDADPGIAPRIIHCVEAHMDRNPQETARKSFARASWNTLYGKGMVPAVYSRYARDARTIGDPRDLPFLKDVIANAIPAKGGVSGDIFVFTNDDIILHKNILPEIRRAVGAWGACSSHRCIVNTRPDINSEALFPTMFAGDTGRDLFAFSWDWLKKYWDNIPDFVLGAPNWDTGLAGLIRYTTGDNSQVRNSSEREINKRYVCHLLHHPQWQDSVNGNAAGEHNDKLARSLFLRFYPGVGFETSRWY